MLPTINTDGKIMSDKKSEIPFNPIVRNPKEQNLSEIIQKSIMDGDCSPGRVDLRRLLVERTMSRHGFTEEQALAIIMAFCR